MIISIEYFQTVNQQIIFLIANMGLISKELFV